jgi:hypothetical protein
MWEIKEGENETIAKELGTNENQFILWSWSKDTNAVFNSNTFFFDNI